MDHVDQCIAQRKICQIVGVNVDQALRVIENPVSKKIFEDAEIVFTDGKTDHLDGKMVKTSNR